MTSLAAWRVKETLGLLVSGGSNIASSTGGHLGHIFLAFGKIGLCRANGISVLGKILTYKDLIFLLNYLINFFLSDRTDRTIIFFMEKVTI